MGVFHATLAGHRAVEEVAAVKLHRGLVAVHFHHAAAFGVLDPRGKPHALTLGQYPTVVVPAPELERLEIRLHPLADRGRLGEIHRRARHRRQLTRRNQPGVGRQVMRRVERQYMVVDRGGRIAREVPVAVMDQIENGRCIRGRAGLPFQLIGIVERVGHLDREIAGVAFLAVL